MTLEKMITNHGKAILAVLDLAETVFSKDELEKMDDIFKEKNWVGLIYDKIIERMNELYSNPDRTGRL